MSATLTDGLRHELPESFGSWAASPSPEGVLAGFTLKPAGDMKNPEHRLSLLSELQRRSPGVHEFRVLHQVHGAEVIEAGPQAPLSAPQADGVYTDAPNLPLMILTADCLPVLMFDEKLGRVAALHVGWRSLAGGIVERALEILTPSFVAFGPSICGECYEVGEELLAPILSGRPAVLGAFSKEGSKLRLDLAEAVSLMLSERGLPVPETHGHCTFFHSEASPSYRRGDREMRLGTFIMKTSD